MPNRDLSERCTMSFRPPCTVWKALSPLHLSYKITSEIDGNSKHSPNHCRSVQSIPKASQRGPDGSKYDPKWLPKTSQNTKKIGVAHLGRRPPPKAATGLPRCSQMAPIMYRKAPKCLQKLFKIVPPLLFWKEEEQKRTRVEESPSISVDLW